MKDQLNQMYQALSLIYNNATELDIEASQEYKILDLVRKLEFEVECIAEENGIDLMD